DHTGASVTNPTVAATDSANPMLLARFGANSTSTSTLVANTGSVERSRPRTSANRVINPIAAARSTLGSGPHSTTKPNKAPVAAKAPTTGPNPTRRNSPSTAPHTIARFAPDTAVRWVRPAVSKSRSTSGG